ncbi:MAG TPA: GTPase ObgE [Deltaproteobacteria bacterium]|nr:GTPase ObgE [Deltaproteobacteria bacterium]HCP46509.1 GTPase ObgE [Deltaproteobacteria bacterium]
MKFLDEVRINATSGAGGDGCVSFRREKFVSRGGPDGGDGGRGGHIIFKASRHFNTLHRLRFSPIIKGKRGTNGGGSRRTGAQGKDTIIEVPQGTLIRDQKDGVVLCDLAEDGAEFLALEGGRGGKGNCRFSTSTRRAPDFAQAGGSSVTSDFYLELKLLADVGLLGFPNAGKSTLISRLSAARPKVAPYPFTTLQPSLGVVEVPGAFQTFVVADIPGLIEGAAEGVGLGHQFLRHVERCSLLLHLVSLDPVEAEANGAVLDRLNTMNQELARYDEKLAAKRQLVLLSKLDLVSSEEVASIRGALLDAGHEVFAASAVSGEGLKELTFALHQAISEDRDD